MKNFIALIVILFGLVHDSFGQDLHFSQFFNSPLTTNPANTGFIPDADYRIGAHYRTQYSSLMKVPYKTLSVFGDAQVFRNKIETGWMGLGALLLRDEAGSGGLVSTKVYGSIAYHQMLGYSSLITAGFNVGWANKRVDQSKLTFPDQFNGKFFDATIVSGAPVINKQVNYLDIQVGLNYAYFPTENIYVNAGYSIHHVNRPQETFFDEPGDNSIAMRHIGFLNALWKARDNVILNPNIYYTTQAGSSELVLGLNAAYDLSGNGDKQLIGGVYYRWNDAFVPVVGFELKHVRFTFSYDVTASSLSKFNSLNGASEFNVIKKGFYNEYEGNRRQTLCPSF